MENITYECCFCNEAIEQDVTAMVIVSNWEKNPIVQQEQQLFCHMSCLQKSVSSKFPIYLADIID